MDKHNKLNEDKIKILLQQIGLGDKEADLFICSFFNKKPENTPLTYDDVSIKNLTDELVKLLGKGEKGI